MIPLRPEEENGYPSIKALKDAECDGVASLLTMLRKETCQGSSRRASADDEMVRSNLHSRILMRFSVGHDTFGLIR